MPKTPANKPSLSKKNTRNTKTRRLCDVFPNIDGVNEKDYKVLINSNILLELDGESVIINNKGQREVGKGHVFVQDLEPKIPFDDTSHLFRILAKALRNHDTNQTLGFAFTEGDDKDEEVEEADKDEDHQKLFHDEDMETQPPEPSEEIAPPPPLPPPPPPLTTSGQDDPDLTEDDGDMDADGNFKTTRKLTSKHSSKDNSSKDETKECEDEKPKKRRKAAKKTFMEIAIDAYESSDPVNYPIKSNVNTMGLNERAALLGKIVRWYKATYPWITLDSITTDVKCLNEFFMELLGAKKNDDISCICECLLVVRTKN